MLDPNDDAAMDAFMRKTLADLESRHTPGSADVREPWLLQAVFDNDDPTGNFVYTVGLSWLGRPELYVSTGDLRAGGYLLNVAAARHIGQPFEPETCIEFDPTTELAVPLRIRGPLAHAHAGEDVPEEWAHVGVAVNVARYRGVDLSVLQCVWPDDQGYWPEAAEYDAGGTGGRFPQRMMPLAVA
jgi:hypothetical protein